VKHDMKNEIRLSFVVIAKDEEVMIGDCLKSIEWADEVLVIDHGSVDKTVEIAKKCGARVVSLPREEKFNYARPRNEGLKEVKGEWIFYVDADERVTGNLRKELLQIANSQSTMDYSWYAVPRLNVILGKEMKHGGWWPDYVKRLYRKSALKKWRGDLHEEPEVVGEMGKLKNPLRHEKHEDLHGMLEKTNKWSEIEGDLMYKAGHPKMNVPRFVTAMWREFWYRMVRKMAFLDGKEGIIMALYQVYSRFISYAKLWEMQMKGEKNE